LYSEERRKRLSDRLKSKISNGEWTPERTSGWTKVRSTIVVNDVELTFRSSWEAIFFICNPSLEYEKLRIPYFDVEANKNRVYITDFVDEKQKIVYEIKPSSLKTSYNCLVKEKAARSWCEEFGYVYKLIDEFAIKELLSKGDNLNLCRSIITDRSMKRSLNSILGAIL